MRQAIHRHTLFLARSPLRLRLYVSSCSCCLPHSFQSLFSLFSPSCARPQPPSFSSIKRLCFTVSLFPSLFPSFPPPFPSPKQRRTPYQPMSHALQSCFVLFSFLARLFFFLSEKEASPLVASRPSRLLLPRVSFCRCFLGLPPSPFFIHMYVSVCVCVRVRRFFTSDDGVSLSLLPLLFSSPFPQCTCLPASLLTPSLCVSLLPLLCC